MTLTPRILLGQRGAKMGLWVSKPNKDVRTCPDVDMLVSPSTLNLQFLAKGVVRMATKGQAVTVLYGSTLLSVPIIWPQAQRNNVSLIPSAQIGSALNTKAGAGDRFVITPSKTSFRVVNNKALIYDLQYMVLHYPIVKV